jgi:hypothetical protein
MMALARPAPAATVDLELLLAVDVSPSVSPGEYTLQVAGLANAIRHPDVIAAIRAAAPNGVAIALMQWAGPTEQALSVPWTAVSDEATAEAVAQRIDAMARPTTNGGTAIGDAIGRGIALLAENEFVAARQVIDLSGDGRTNVGNSPGPIRAYAAASGITVNGLVILNDEPDLDIYYLQRVVAGPGSFVLEADDFADFAEAIRLKLIREIAGEMTAAAPAAAGTRVVGRARDAEVGLTN